MTRAIRRRLVHSPGFPIESFESLLRREEIEPTAFDGKTGKAFDRRLAHVILLDPQVAAHEKPHGLDEQRFVVVRWGASILPEWLTLDKVVAELAEDVDPDEFLSGITRAFEDLDQTLRTDHLERQLNERSLQLEELNKVGMSLSTIRDHSVLMKMILSKSRELSRSDAGSLYLLDEIPGVGKVLRWKLAQNDSIAVNFEEKVLPITKKSLAGFVALTGQTLVIDDAYDLPPDVEYSINRSFDTENGYLTRSMLLFPMKNHSGDTIGVLQLINRKRRGKEKKLTAASVPHEVIPFDQPTIDLMRSLAGQATIAVENNYLYDSIERLFEGFVTAAVTAIEQRDPTTSGHSFRVAELTVALAKIVDQIPTGLFSEVRFSTDQLREIRYASLLHDFGKVGVREQVLVKQKKLYPLQLDVIRFRFEYVVKEVETRFTKMKLDHLLKHGPEGFQAVSEQLDHAMNDEIAALKNDFQFITQSNEPTVLPEGDFQYLQALGTREFEDGSGQRRPLLGPEEARILSIRKGNLDQMERSEIESHVTHTFHFLSKIPWTKDLMGVPNIAYAHHEKLNGRGYPLGLPAEKIPLQSRMMTVSDIYDALTANDRPYKRAVPTDRALDILKMEVKDGLIDPAVVDVFIEAKVFEVTQPHG
ncbi:MAG TPA: HD domain-containing phosphohydrolase [Thermoanaerobaculia bacterium]|nr:HD domain-containing phosphohydrolase [Thermoanaerobaculia bacterium]